MTVPSAPVLRAIGTGGISVRTQIAAPVDGADSYTLFRSSDALFSDEAILNEDPSLKPDWDFDVSGVGESYWYRATANSEPVDIDTSSIDDPTVITTVGPHGLTTGDQVRIEGHTSVTPAIDGFWEATVLTADTFTIPIEVTADGAGGTVKGISLKSDAILVTVIQDEGSLSPTQSLRYERTNR